MEKRLIDANAACQRCSMQDYGHCWNCIIGTAPTVKVENVIHCRECIYWDKDGRCNGHDNGLVMEYTMGVDYCSYGKRKDDE